MKIKQKKQFTLPQLIEWGFENGVHGAQFKSDRGKRVGFRHMGYFWTEYEIDKDDTFTIEFEKTVTEDTVIPKLLLVYESEDSHFIEGRSIKGLSKSCIEAIHILNDDLTMTLIWRNGRLVE